jgi:hypothetical protein
MVLAGARKLADIFSRAMCTDQCAMYDLTADLGCD